MGCSLLTPVIHPHTDLQALPLLGRVVSHGYLTCGFLPVRIAFPTLVQILLGPATTVPDNILLQSFADSLSTYEASVLREAFHRDSISSELKTKLVTVLGRFGCREVPTHDSLRQMVINVARYQFLVKPLAAVAQMNCGIPAVHAAFWRTLSVERLFSLYLALTASPEKVLERLESDALNPNEQRVFGYLEQFIGNMTQDVLRSFLRFTTGSSVCISSKITVTFNSLSGLARRPLSHTCDCVLELPTTYITYPEFVSEFEAILSEPEYTWRMDSI